MGGAKDGGAKEVGAKVLEFGPALISESVKLYYSVVANRDVCSQAHGLLCEGYSLDWVSNEPVIGTGT